MMTLWQWQEVPFCVILLLIIGGPKWPFLMMLWFGVCSSDLRIHHTRNFVWGFWLLTAAMAAGATVAAVTAAWAAALVATAAAAWLAAMAAAAAWLAAVATTIVAATIVAAVTATAFLGALSLSYHLTTVCLRHHRCNSQDTRIIWNFCYSGVSCIWTRAASTVASLRGVSLTTALFCIWCVLALAILRLGILFRLACGITVTFLFVALTFSHFLLGTITFSVDLLLLLYWYFASAFIGVCLFPLICNQRKASS